MEYVLFFNTNMVFCYFFPLLETTDTQVSLCDFFLLIFASLREDKPYANNQYVCFKLQSSMLPASTLCAHLLLRLTIVPE